MIWGYRVPLSARVVALEIPSNSQIGFQHQTTTVDGGRPTLVRKKSPPLGIPLAAMDDMQEEYRGLIRNIVHDDLANYVPIAYDDQDSDLAERLLTTVGQFYCASKDYGNEVLAPNPFLAWCIMLTGAVRTSASSARDPRNLHDHRTKSNPRRRLQVHGRELSQPIVPSAIRCTLRTETGQTRHVSRPTGAHREGPRGLGQHDVDEQ
jgi:hypothetical protein